MITYILHSTILLSAITAIYWLALRHETFFKLNRWTIMACVFLSLLLPMIHVPAEYVPWRSNEKPIDTIVEKIVPHEGAQATIPSEAATPSKSTKYDKKKAKVEPQPTSTAESNNDSFQMASIGKILTYIYFIGVGIFTIGFHHAAYRIIRHEIQSKFFQNRKVQYRGNGEGERTFLFSQYHIH